MSLCLAATCALDESRQAIVYCCDRAGTRGSVQSEDIDKVRRVGSATVLLAGNNSEAKQLLSACRGTIEKYPLGGNDMDMDRLISGLKEAVRQRKRAIATGHLSAELGLTYDEVFNWSQTRPDDPIFAGAWQRIRSLSLGAELVVGTFTGNEAAILVIESTGHVGWVDHYAAVGAGDQIASVFLHQRDYSDVMSLEECIYRVLEAKMAAQKNPFVGKQTDVRIGFSDRLLPVSQKYISDVSHIIDNKRSMTMLLPLDMEPFS